MISTTNFHYFFIFRLIKGFIFKSFLILLFFFILFIYFFQTTDSSDINEKMNLFSTDIFFEEQNISSEKEATELILLNSEKPAPQDVSSSSFLSEKEFKHLFYKNGLINTAGGSNRKYFNYFSNIRPISAMSFESSYSDSTKRYLSLNISSFYTNNYLNFWTTMCLYSQRVLFSFPEGLFQSIKLENSIIFKFSFNFFSLDYLEFMKKSERIQEYVDFWEQTEIYEIKNKILTFEYWPFSKEVNSIIYQSFAGFFIWTIGLRNDYIDDLLLEEIRLLNETYIPEVTDDLFFKKVEKWIRNSEKLINAYSQKVSTRVLDKSVKTNLVFLKKELLLYYNKITKLTPVQKKIFISQLEKKLTFLRELAKQHSLHYSTIEIDAQELLENELSTEQLFVGQSLARSDHTVINKHKEDFIVFLNTEIKLLKKQMLEEEMQYINYRIDISYQLSEERKIFYREKFKMQKERLLEKLEKIETEQALVAEPLKEQILNKHLSFRDAWWFSNVVRNSENYPFWKRWYRQLFNISEEGLYSHKRVPTWKDFFFFPKIYIQPDYAHMVPYFLYNDDFFLMEEEDFYGTTMEDQTYPVDDFYIDGDDFKGYVSLFFQHNKQYYYARNWFHKNYHPVIEFIFKVPIDPYFAHAWLYKPLYEFSETYSLSWPFMTIHQMLLYNSSDPNIHRGLESWSYLELLQTFALFQGNTFFEAFNEFNVLPVDEFDDDDDFEMVPILSLPSISKEMMISLSKEYFKFYKENFLHLKKEDQRISGIATHELYNLFMHGELDEKSWPLFVVAYDNFKEVNKLFIKKIFFYSNIESLSDLYDKLDFATYFKANGGTNLYLHFYFIFFTTIKINLILEISNQAIIIEYFVEIAKDRWAWYFVWEEIVEWWSGHFWESIVDYSEYPTLLLKPRYYVYLFKNPISDEIPTASLLQERYLEIFFLVKQIIIDVYEDLTYTLIVTAHGYIKEEIEWDYFYLEYPYFNQLFLNFLDVGLELYQASFHGRETYPAAVLAELPLLVWSTPDEILDLKTAIEMDSFYLNNLTTMYNFLENKQPLFTTNMLLQDLNSTFSAQKFDIIPLIYKKLLLQTREQLDQYGGIGYLDYLSQKTGSDINNFFLTTFYIQKLHWDYMEYVAFKQVIESFKGMLDVQYYGQYDFQDSFMETYEDEDIDEHFYDMFRLQSFYTKYPERIFCEEYDSFISIPTAYRRRYLNIIQRYNAITPRHLLWYETPWYLEANKMLPIFYSEKKKWRYMTFLFL